MVRRGKSRIGDLSRRQQRFVCRRHACCENIQRLGWRLILWMLWVVVSLVRWRMRREVVPVQPGLAGYAPLVFEEQGSRVAVVRVLKAAKLRIEVKKRILSQANVCFLKKMKK